MNLQRILRKYIKKIKGKKDTHSRYKRILRRDIGESFKGHSFDFSFNADKKAKKGTLSIHNKYYSGQAGQHYNIDRNSTLSYYTITGDTPIWLAKKMSEIGEQFTGIPMGKTRQDGYSLEINDNPTVLIDPLYYYVHYQVSTKGVNFNNHFENINELKSLTYFYREIREKLKVGKVIEILEYIYPCTKPTGNFLDLRTGKTCRIKKSFTS